MEHFKSFRKCCPEKAASTHKAYCYSMKFLQDRVPELGIPEVLAALKDEKVSRQCNCLTALKAYYRYIKKDTESSENLTLPLSEAKERQYKKRAEQKATPHMKRNWVPFKCLKREVGDLRKQIFTWDKNAPWPKAQFHQAQCCFLMNFMLRYNVRRSLATVNYLNETKNRLDTKSQKLILTDYKNSKTHGPAEFQLSRELWKQFSWLRKQHRLRGLNTGALLVNMHWKPMTCNALT